jgi:hypothetical protein
MHCVICGSSVETKCQIEGCAEWLCPPPYSEECRARHGEFHSPVRAPSLSAASIVFNALNAKIDRARHDYAVLGDSERDLRARLSALTKWVKTAVPDLFPRAVRDGMARESDIVEA